MSRENDLYNAVHTRLDTDATLITLIGSANNIYRNLTPVKIGEFDGDEGFISISDVLSDGEHFSVDRTRFIISAWVHSSATERLANIQARVRVLLDGWDSAITWVEQFTRESVDPPSLSAVDGLVFSRSQFVTTMSREALS